MCIVLSCALLLVFSGLKWHILVTQSPKYTRLKRITNQFIFVYTVVKSLYILLSCQIIFSCKSYLLWWILNLYQFVLWLQYKSSSSKVAIYFISHKFSKVSVFVQLRIQFMLSTGQRIPSPLIPCHSHLC